MAGRQQPGHDLDKPASVWYVIVTIKVMAATIEISLPDVLIKAIGANPKDLPRRAFESLVSDAYRSGKISHAQVSEMLGLDRWKTDAFLKQAQAFRACETEEFAGDLSALRKLATK
jgi:hypothetical protein